MSDGGDRPARPRAVRIPEGSAALEGGHRLPRGSVAAAQAPHSFAADEVALAALGAQRAASQSSVCDVCDRPIDGESAGSGLYFWMRDGEARWEEPLLCSRCAPAIGMSALKRWASEEGE